MSVSGVATMNDQARSRPRGASKIEQKQQLGTNHRKVLPALDIAAPWA
jgi:hypothetical protein